MILLAALVSICVRICKLLEKENISVYDKLILNLLEVSTVEVIPLLQLCSKDYTEIDTKSNL
jgi:hypothetical protein